MVRAVGKKIDGKMVASFQIAGGAVLQAEQISGSWWIIRGINQYDRAELQEMDESIVLFADLYANGKDAALDDLLVALGVHHIIKADSAST